MTITWFTFATVAIAALLIGTHIWKGIKKGTRGALLSVLVAVFSVIVGILVSRLLAPLFGYLVIVYLRNSMANGYYVGGTAGMEAIIRYFTEMLSASVVFTAVFFVIQLPVNAVVQLVYKRLVPEDRAACVDSIVADNSQNQKSERLWGGLLGAISGIIAMAVVIAPVMGTLKTMNKASDVMDGGGEHVWEFMSMDSEQMYAADKYSTDLAGTVFYCMGGELIYRASAATTINGKNASLPSEMDSIAENVAELMALLPIFGDLSPISEDEQAQMNSFCDNLDGSHIMKYFSVEFVTGCSDAWLGGGEYFGMTSPEFGDVLGPVFKDILRVCQTTDVNFIVQDMRSLFNVYTIILNSGFIGENYEILLDDISTAEGFVQQIEEEIAKNPRLSPVKNSLKNTAMRVFAEEIHLPDYGSEVYDDLMTNLATAINLVNSEEGASDEARRRMLSTYAQEYIGDFGADVSDDMVDITSDMLLERFEGHEGDVMPEDMDQFFKEILG